MRQRRSHLVTAHAVLRWIERVEGFDLAPWRAAAQRAGVDPHDEGRFLGFLDQHAAIEIGEVSARILSPVVRIAIRSGATSVRSGRWRLIINSRRVVTVLAIEWDTQSLIVAGKRRLGGARQRRNRRDWRREARAERETEGETW